MVWSSKSTSGSRLEKELTVPASYPMTLNALRTACNQLNSRDPVVDYDDALVHTAHTQNGHLRLADDRQAHRETCDDGADAEATDHCQPNHALARQKLLHGNMPQRRPRL